MQLLFMVNTCAMVRTTMHTFGSAGYYLGMRSRLQASSWRGQWCGAVNTLRQLSANASWDHNLYGKSTTMLILVTLQLTLGHFLTCAYMRPCQLIMLSCTRHTLCSCTFLVIAKTYAAKGAIRVGSEVTNLQVQSTVWTYYVLIFPLSLWTFLSVGLYVPWSAGRLLLG